VHRRERDTVRADWESRLPGIAARSRLLPDSTTLSSSAYLVDASAQTLMKLEQRMEELKAQFALEDDDLDSRLGPLADLLD
jgi:hypothetical protein